MPDEAQSQTTIDGRSRPCRCYGAPINPVWLGLHTAFVVGYECAQCGRRWPTDYSREARRAGR